jgi:hypothetical protein
MKCIAHEIDYCPTCNTLPTPKAFTASFAGWATAPDDWSNSVTVHAVEHWDAGFGGEVTDTDDDYADRGAVRELVEIDTNYKPTRPGLHPVRLTRADAVTFSPPPCSKPPRTPSTTPAAASSGRPKQRSCSRRCAPLSSSSANSANTSWPTSSTAPVTASSRRPYRPRSRKRRPAESAPAAELIPAIPVADDSLAGAIVTLFPTAAGAIMDSDAFGALSHKVNRRCQDTGETPTQVLSSIDPDDRAFAPNAADPAAFLASRIDS